MSVPVKVDEKRELLKRTLGRDLTDDELDLFAEVCRQTQLDPFIKQIYPVKRSGKMTIQVGIDGLRSIAERTGKYSPGKETVYNYDKNGHPLSATAYVKKMTADGTWHDVSATAFVPEYRPSYKNDFWDNKPHIMIGKCAEALAIRKAFPSVTANLYTDDEMGQAEPVITGVQRPVKVEQIDPRANEDVLLLSDSVVGVARLESILAYDELPFDRLREWLKIRADLKDQSIDSVVDACCKVPEVFRKSYAKWLESLNIPESTTLAV